MPIFLASCIHLISIVIRKICLRVLGISPQNHNQYPDRKEYDTCNGCFHSVSIPRRILKSNYARSNNRYPQVSVIHTCASKQSCDNSEHGVQYEYIGIQSGLFRGFLRNPPDCTPVVRILVRKVWDFCVTQDTKSEPLPLLSKQQKESAMCPDNWGLNIAPRDMGGLHGIIYRRLRARMRVEKTPTRNCFCSFCLSIIKVVKEQYHVTSSTLSDRLQCLNIYHHLLGIPEKHNSTCGNLSFLVNPSGIISLL